MPSPGGQSKEEIREYYRTVGRFLELEIAGRGDSGYWQRRAREQPRPHVLELGAGTGRVTRLLAPLVESLVAVDLSAEMLERARQSLAPLPSNVHLVLADMRELRFACTFDLILAANDPFAHLTTGRERDRVLRRVARHLRPRGLFILDAVWLTPSTREKARSPGGWWRRRSLGEPEDKLSVVERWSLEGDGPQARVEYEYREGDRVVGRAAFHSRLWTPEEVAGRFLAAGLRVRRILGGYDERPWDPSSASGLIVEGELDPELDPGAAPPFHVPRS
jgi:SAM-dependent methyltransferase